MKKQKLKQRITELEARVAALEAALAERPVVLLPQPLVAPNWPSTSDRTWPLQETIIYC